MKTEISNLLLNPHKKAKNLKVHEFADVLRKKSTIPNSLLVGKLSSLSLRIAMILHTSQKNRLFLTSTGVNHLLQINENSKNFKKAYHVLFNCGLLMQVKVKRKTFEPMLSDIISSTWSINKFDITHLVNAIKEANKCKFKIYNYQSKEWSDWYKFNSFVNVSNAGRNFSIKPELL